MFLQVFKSPGGNTSELGRRSHRLAPLAWMLSRLAELSTWELILEFLGLHDKSPLISFLWL